MNTSGIRQKGMTLVIGLIMLVMISLAAIASYQMSRTTLEVVGNMQFQNEAVAAADRAIQEALSTERFHTTPTNALPNPCGANNTRCFDFNNDGTTDVTAVLATPSCVKMRVTPNKDLNLDTINPLTNLPVDAGCSTGDPYSGVQRDRTGDSLCTDTIWNLEITATDNATNTSIVVTQGVSETIKTTDADSFCL